ncbi:MAG: hypothetical protein APF81_23870 [Desulfosporosinus sp. BRH_c37]|nr:MAG: hypothetical protein APF81_23870 [Desulfosporosinus sp. BRH_c37]
MSCSVAISSSAYRHGQRLVLAKFLLGVKYCCIINKCRRKEVLSPKKENKIVFRRVFEFFLKVIPDRKTKKEDSVNFRRRIV